MTTVFSKPLGDEVKALSYQMAHKLSFYQYDIGTTAKNFAVSNGTRLLIVTVSTYSAHRGMYITATGGSGDTYKTDVLAASGITITVSNNNVSISTASNSGLAYLLVLSGSITGVS